jgi:hypothetical protein
MIALLLAGCADHSLVGVAGASGAATCDGDSGALSGGWADDLAPDGCRYFVQAPNDDGSVLLTLDVPAFSDTTAGDAVSYALPDETVRLEVTTGCGLDQGLCGEAASFEPSVSRTYTPTAGTLDITLARGDTTTATVTFTDVAFEADDGATTTLTATTWEVALYPEE